MGPGDKTVFLLLPHCRERVHMLSFSKVTLISALPLSQPFFPALPLSVFFPLFVHDGSLHQHTHISPKKLPLTNTTHSSVSAPELLTATYQNRMPVCLSFLFALDLTTPTILLYIQTTQTQTSLNYRFSVNTQGNLTKMHC